MKFFILKSVKWLFCMMSFYFITLEVNSQTVSTLIAAFPGDGEMSFDNLGNIYVNDSGVNGVLNGHKVYKVNPNDGTFTLFHQNLPIWVVGSIFDLNNNLLVTGWSAGTISRISLNGASSSIIVNGISGAGSLEVDVSGNIYVAEYLTHNVLKFDSNGGGFEVYSSGSPIQNPAGLAYEPSSGNLYVSNWTNNKIVVIDGNGNASDFATIPVPSVGPIKIFNGYMFATSPQYHRIYKIDMMNPTDVELFAGTGVRGNKDGDIGTATFDTPTGITTLDGNTFYIAETYQGTGRLRIIENVGLGSNEINVYDDLMLFPNPCTAEFKLSSNVVELNYISILISDLNGHRIVNSEGILMSDQLTLNAEMLDSGVYFLRVTDDLTNEIIKVFKFMKI